MATVEEFVEIVRSGDERRFKQMIETDPGIAQTAVDSYGGCSAPQLAMYVGQEDFAWALYRLHPHPDFATACTLGDLDRVRELLGQQHDLLEDFSNDGFTPLCLASAYRHTRLVNYLLDEGADPNGQSQAQGGVRPLDCAVIGRSRDVVRLLLDMGADPNLSYDGGQRPVHGAAKNGDQVMLENLVMRGADIRARTQSGDTPLSLARSKGHHHVAHYIESNFGGM
ncbi:MAG: ankyrin repeat domain-containing protein [Armatimonadetes bacterium]|nr:ankyrin repeat domain-containing protein [Armatimonadota bacterium]